MLAHSCAATLKTWPALSASLSPLQVFSAPDADEMIPLRFFSNVSFKDERRKKKRKK
jgi:hypothetical protein